MIAAARLNDVTDLTWFQRERRFFKLLLHLAVAKVAEIATLAGAAAVRLARGQLAETGRARPDARLVTQDDGQRLLLGSRDVGFLPRRRAAALAVLHQEMASTHLFGIVIP